MGYLNQSLLQLKQLTSVKKITNLQIMCEFKLWANRFLVYLSIVSYLYIE